MSILIYLAVFFFLIILAAVAGTYAIIGAKDIGQNSKYDDDHKLQQAYKYLLIAGIVSWLVIVLVIIGIVLFFMYGGTYVMYAMSWLAIGLIILVGAMSIAVGVLCIIAANDIVKSPNYSGDGSDLKAYHAAIIAASCAIGSVGIVILIGIVYFVMQSRKKKQVREAKAKQEEFKHNIIELKEEEILEAKRARLLREKELNAARAAQATSASI
jgi:hypothetical protein